MADQDPLLELYEQNQQRQAQYSRSPVSPTAPAGQLGAPSAVSGTPPQAPPVPSKGVGQILGEAAVNLPGDIGQQASELWHAVTSPVETAKNIYKLGAGSLSKLSGAAGLGSFDPEDEQVANAVGQYIADNYGSWSKVGQSLSQHPARTLMDLSLPFTGGASVAKLGAKTAGIASKAAEAAGLAKTAAAAQAAEDVLGAAGSQLRTVAAGMNVVNPVSMLNTATKFLPYIGSIGFNKAAKIMSGTEKNLLDQAKEAGFEGSQAFKDGLYGNIDDASIVDRYKDMLSAAKNKLGQDFNATLSKTGNIMVPDYYDNIYEDINNTANKYSSMGLTKYQDIDKARNMLLDRVSQYAASDNPYHSTIPGLNDVKIAMRDVASNFPTGSKGQAFIYDVANQLRNRLAKVSPDYIKAMEDYEDGIQDAAQMGKSLSGNNIDTIIKRVTGAAKNNNYLWQVISQQDPEFVNLIAGRALAAGPAKSIAERAIQSGVEAMAFGVPPKQVAAAALAGAATSRLRDPGTYASLAYKAGQAQKLFSPITKAKQFTGIPYRYTREVPDVSATVQEKVQPGSVPQIFTPYQAPPRPPGNQYSIPTPEHFAAGGRTGYASGGKITADHLIRLAEDAKKSISKASEPLLNTPDEAVARALAVVNKNI